MQFSEPSLAALGRRNLDGYQGAVLSKLTAASAHPPKPAIAPLGILSVIQWSYFTFVARHPAVSLERLERALATMLHAFLFKPADPNGGWPVTGDDADQLPSIPLGDAMGLRRPVTARGVGTVQRILLAAADRFRGTGFYGTSLSDIATTAGVSHGSVYTYWADRDALFATLAQDAAGRGGSPGAVPGRGPAHRGRAEQLALRVGWRCSTCTARCCSSGPMRSTHPNWPR